MSLIFGSAHALFQVGFLLYAGPRQQSQAALQHYTILSLVQLFLISCPSPHTLSQLLASNMDSLRKSSLFYFGVH